MCWLPGGPPDNMSLLKALEEEAAFRRDAAPAPPVEAEGKDGRRARSIN
jgi:hypothetical protein